MILSFSIDQNRYLQSSLKEFKKSFKCLTSNDIHMIDIQLDLLLNTLHEEKKKKRGRVSNEVCIGKIECGHSVYKIFIKALIIMSISINVYIPYMCDSLCPYILLVKNFVDLIMRISQPS